MKPEAPAFTPIEEMSYNECLSELENIVRRMQSDACDIDLLAAYTGRASRLLEACRSRLTATEEELGRILDRIRPE